ncbi:MAG: nickel pincer cofactor biosynthesis protein LarB [Bacillota bacterium]|nr:nickel pincer cofactor biosynthesis protein LarB [Bacillota bacterium]
MDNGRLKQLLQQVADGRLPVAEATEQLRHIDYEDIGFAKLDHQRELRRGFPEVVYGAGKSAEQIAAIFERLHAKSRRSIIATRCDADKYAAVAQLAPQVEYNATARMIYIPAEGLRSSGLVAVLCAGTSDLPVAEEAALTAELMGARVERVYDVGVAGLHRLLAHQRLIAEARVLVVVAGMEGALASVVGGMAAAPVIAVPTSIGYGASFEGLAALLSMLNSCSSGVVTVNIDNGFGGGYAAALINRQSAC